MVKAIELRPVNIHRDFSEMAVLFSLEDEHISKPALIEDYQAHKTRIFNLKVAEDEQGELMGFNWATRNRFNETDAFIYIIVKPEQRRQGAGKKLYEDLELSARSAGIDRLEGTIRDNRPECMSFALSCGFKERFHSLGMELDLSRIR